MLKYIAPLVIFSIVAIFLALGLKLNPREIPSPFIDKPAPGFSLTVLSAPDQLLATDDLKGQVWMLNVWASWCGSCRVEHPLLNQLAGEKLVTLVGLNYKDEPLLAKSWLQQLGNPYTVSVSDTEGRTGIDWGVYGVPETFLIDKQGVVRYKLTGPVSEAIINQKIKPLIAQLQAEKV